MSSRFQAPRGTFDILPAERPARAPRLRGRGELVRARRLRADRDARSFEDTELFARGVGEGTDIVHKEMFTFADQGGRSLTLRPEATAAICRAYIEHGMHRLPQPVKLWCVGPVLPPRAPAGGALSPVPPARRRGDRLRLAARRRRADPAARRPAARARRPGPAAAPLEPRHAELARRLPRGAARLPARPRGRARAPTCASGSTRTRCAPSTPRTRGHAGGDGRGAADARPPRRRRRRALRRGPRACSTAPGSTTSSTAPWSAGSTTTPAPCSSSSPSASTPRRRRSAAAAATTGWSRRSAARRPRAAAGRPGSSGSCSRSPSPSPSRAPTSSSPRRTARASARFALVRELRGAGLRAELDLAGRSIKGQMKQADRIGARRAVILDEDGARRGARHAERRAARARPRAARSRSSSAMSATPSSRPCGANEYRDAWCGQVLGDRVDSEVRRRRLGPPPPRPRRARVHRPARPHRARPARLPPGRVRRGVRARAPPARRGRAQRRRARSSAAIRRPSTPSCRPGEFEVRVARGGAARRRADAAVRDRGLLGRGRRGGAASPPLPRPAPRADGARRSSSATAVDRGDPRLPRRRGLPRDRDADALALDPRGRARLPRPVRAASRARSTRCRSRRSCSSSC